MDCCSAFIKSDHDEDINTLVYVNVSPYVRFFAFFGLRFIMLLFQSEFMAKTLNKWETVLFCFLNSVCYYQDLSWIQGFFQNKTHSDIIEDLSKVRVM